MKKLLSLLLLVLLVVTCFSGCGILSDDSSDEGSSNEGKSDVCLVGNKIKSGDLQFSFTGVEIYVDNSSIVMDKAEEGKEYVILNIEVKNTGKDNEHVNMFYEKSYCDDVAIDPESILFNHSGETIWGDVASGKIRKGYIAYEAPIGWEKIEFTYDPLGDNEITLVAYSKNVDRNGKVENTEKNDKEETSSNNQQTTQTTPPPQTHESVCKVGETLTSNNLEFTFVGIENYVDTSDWVLDKPENGYEFVILKLKAKNVGQEPEYINMFSEDSYCDDVAVEPESLLFNYGGETIWGDVAQGKVRMGYVAYELPIGWEKIEFTYDFSLLGNGANKITFVGCKSDIK